MQQRDPNRHGFSPFQMYLADGVQQPDGSWARTGEYITVVGKDSAVLGLLQAVEERMKSEGNHYTMVKFNGRSNVEYAKALNSLYRFEKKAKSVVKRQFRSST